MVSKSLEKNIYCVFEEIICCISYFHYCFDKIFNQSNLMGKRDYYGSPFQGFTVHHLGEDIQSGFESADG